jgi:hypothetical protein
MEKVIYSNLYRRCGEVVNEMKSNLDTLYSFDGITMENNNRD